MGKVRGGDFLLEGVLGAFFWGGGGVGHKIYLAPANQTEHIFFYEKQTPKPPLKFPTPHPPTLEKKKKKKKGFCELGSA